MKNFLVLLSLSTLLFVSCDKAKDSSSPEPLIASVSGVVHISQPVTFTIPSVAANSTVNWSVTPNTATITPNGNTASVSFAAAGSYKVMGSSGSTSASSNVTVDSVNYLPMNGSTTASFSTGEQLNISVSRADSSASASGLIFTMKTASSYSCLNSVLAFTAANGAGGAATYTINVTGVSVPMAGCTAGSSKAVGTATTRIPLPAGTTTLTVVFNGTTYTGSIVKTGNSYAITWSYTSGVTLSPTTL